MGDPNSNGTRPSYSFVSLNVIDEEIDCGHLHHKFGVSDYDSLIQEDRPERKLIKTAAQTVGTEMHNTSIQHKIHFSQNQKSRGTLIDLAKCAFVNSVGFCSVWICFVVIPTWVSGSAFYLQTFGHICDGRTRTSVDLLSHHDMCVSRVGRVTRGLLGKVDATLEPCTTGLPMLRHLGSASGRTKIFFALNSGLKNFSRHVS